MSVTGAHQKELAEAGISLACDDARQIAMRDASIKQPSAGGNVNYTPFGKISFGRGSWKAYDRPCGTGTAGRPCSLRDRNKTPVEKETQAGI